MRSLKQGRLLACMATAVLFAGCGGGGGNSAQLPSNPGVGVIDHTPQPGAPRFGSSGLIPPGNGSPGSGPPGLNASPNAALRTSSIATIHALVPTIAGLFLYGSLPSAAQQAKRSVQLPALLHSNKRATSRLQQDLTLEDNLKLYYSTSQVGVKFTFNFFTDAAGTIPGGIATATLPVSGAVFPNTTSVVFNITGGRFPGDGTASITNITKDLQTIAGDLHLVNGNIRAHTDLTIGTDAGGRSTFTGGATIMVGSQTVTVTNVNIDANFVFSGNMSVQPLGYTGTLSITGNVTIQLASGSKTFTATLLSQDVNNQQIVDPGLDLVYPDATKESIPVALAAPVQ